MMVSHVPHTYLERGEFENPFRSETAKCMIMRKLWNGFQLMIEGSVWMFRSGVCPDQWPITGATIFIIQTICIINKDSQKWSTPI